MTQHAIESGDLAPNPAGAGDPELATICALGRLMALSPWELISRIELGTATGNLAASCASPGAGDNPPRGGLTGAAFASLASIARSLQRNPLPPLKPGQGTLLPAPSPPAPSARPAEIEPHGDDEPVPALSTWRQPASNDEDRRLRQQVRAGALGLVAALALFVPTLLWLGGWPGAQLAPADGDPMPVRAVETPVPARAIEAPQLPEARPSATTEEGASTAPRKPAGAAELSAAVTAEPAPVVGAVQTKPAAEEVVQEARRRIDSGDVAGARDLLAGVDNDPQGLVGYALAETYDPNMLAAWGARGIAADVAKAKVLYGEALERGNALAGRRLDALQ
jgi:hypothetical protein